MLIHCPKLKILRDNAAVVCNMIKSALPCILFSICYFHFASANFLEGEFVPTARRAQFHGVRIAMPRMESSLYVTIAPVPQMMLQVRTTWHDLLGRHCPRFGQDRVVSTAAMMQYTKNILTKQNGALLHRLLCHYLTRQDSVRQTTIKCLLLLTVSSLTLAGLHSLPLLMSCWVHWRS